VIEITLAFTHLNSVMWLLFFGVHTDPGKVRKFVNLLW